MARRISRLGELDSAQRHLTHVVCIHVHHVNPEDHVMTYVPTPRENDTHTERRARRAARRAGHILQKSRATPSRDNCGRFRILDGHTGHVIAGHYFELTPEDVIDFCGQD